MGSKSYGPHPTFGQGLGWHPENSGHVVVNLLSSENTVVGRILEDLLNCGPGGKS